MMQEVCTVYNILYIIDIDIQSRFLQIYIYINIIYIYTYSDKHVIGMVYAVKVCSDSMRLRASI